ncbi:hypothetical protein ABIA13_005260 [Sinorhizobium fredii]
MFRKFQWTAPNSPNYYVYRIYIHIVHSFGTATLSATEYLPPSAVDRLACAQWWAWRPAPITVGW